MQDDPTHSIPRTVNLDDSTQVARLCDKFECSESELREAVRMVGPTHLWVEQWIRWLKTN